MLERGYLEENTDSYDLSNFNLKTVVFIDSLNTLLQHQSHFTCVLLKLLLEPFKSQQITNTLGYIQYIHNQRVTQGVQIGIAISMDPESLPKEMSSNYNQIFK